MTASPEPALVDTDTCHDWRAVLDSQGHEPSTLRVTGICTFPTEDYRVTLSRHEPQGFNPRILLLDKTVSIPTIPQGGPQEVEARYGEEAAPGQFDTVTILPEGRDIPVEEVSSEDALRVSRPEDLPILEYGDRSEAVRCLQKFMTRVFPLYCKYEATGYYGDKTAGCVLSFQEREKIKNADGSQPDGRTVGKRTNAALFKHGYRGC